jgi:membrane protein
MKATLVIIFDLARKSIKEWSNDNAFELAAAIAYYTIFSMPPLLIIAMAVAGYFYNMNAARDQLIAQIGRIIGPRVAGLVDSLVVNSARSSDSFLASLISVIVLLVGASGVFYQIQYALNMIWDVPRIKSRGMINTLKNRFLSFLMVLVVGFLLLVFLIVSPAVSIFLNQVKGVVQLTLFPEVINILVALMMISVLFAIIYRLIPDKEITWTDVWLGAIITSLLFMLGRYAIGFYVTISKPGSAYGAAGTLIVLLLWVYYSAEIFLLGAEFTKVYARNFGSLKQPGETSMAQE